MQIKRPRISSWLFNLLLAFLFSTLYNLALWVKTYHILSADKHAELWFIISLPLFIFTVLNIFFNLLVWPYVYRIVISILILLSAVSTYAMYNYGVLVDPTIMQSVFETGQGESLGYLSTNFVICFVVIGIIPLMLFNWIQVKFCKPFWKEIVSKLVSILVSLVLLVLIFLTCYESYAAFGRNNKEIRYVITPTNYIISTIRLVKHVYINSIPYKQMGLDAKDLDSQEKRKNLLILVVGETSRAANYSLNGYHRDTNPLLAKQDVISFKDFRSCGTATLESVPCMFSNMSRSNYDAITAKKQDGLLDVLNHAGLRLLWRENDEGCKGVCKNIPTEEMTKLNLPEYCHNGSCYDTILFKGLQSYIDKSSSKDTVIVLHIVGSHGPNYYQRYPKSFTRFKPVCDRNDIQNCSHEALVNTYDNTIYYTDFILNKVINTLKKNTQMNTAMIYLSDHGEALGENGYYLHGMPYFIAPKPVTTVPFILWFSPKMEQHKKMDLSCLKKEAERGGYSQDYLYSSVLSLMDVKTKLYDSKLDIFFQCSITKA